MLRRLAGRCLMGAGALMLALTAVTSAFAQGMFYAEETKDGRVYVFNNKGNWERFKASGETGTGLTRLSVGPNGETVYADNETALELYFFKHDIKEVVERPKAPTSARRVARRQDAHHDRQLLPGDVEPHPGRASRDELPDDSITAARARRARATARARSASAARSSSSRAGSTSPGSSYETQLNWPDVSGTPPARMLEDANIDWDITKGKKTFRVRFGQFKAPYGRQQITSSGAQQFVDRSIIDERYNPTP